MNEGKLYNKVNIIFEKSAACTMKCVEKFYQILVQILSCLSCSGFTCQEHNNPPDFFLDVINGDLRALSDDQTEDVDLESE